MSPRLDRQAGTILDTRVRVLTVGIDESAVETFEVGSVGRELEQVAFDDFDAGAGEGCNRVVQQEDKEKQKTIPLALSLSGLRVMPTTSYPPSRRYLQTEEPWSPVAVKTTIFFPDMVPYCACCCVFIRMSEYNELLDG